MPSCLDTYFSGFAEGNNSPFDRLLAWELYDGPVSGLVFCTDREAYLFDLMAWDEEQRVRVFSLSTISHASVSVVLEGLAEIESPRWPEWWIKGSGDSAGTAKLQQLIRDARAATSPAAWVVVTADLLHDISMRADLKDGDIARRFGALSQRANPEDEVRVGSFSEWVELATTNS